MLFWVNRQRLSHFESFPPEYHYISQSFSRCCLGGGAGGPRGEGGRRKVWIEKTWKVSRVRGTTSIFLQDTIFLTDIISICSLLLAPSGALVAIPTYY